MRVRKWLSAIGKYFSLFIAKLERRIKITLRNTYPKFMHGAKNATRMQVHKPSGEKPWLCVWLVSIGKGFLCGVYLYTCSGLFFLLTFSVMQQNATRHFVTNEPNERALWGVRQIMRICFESSMRKQNIDLANDNNKTCEFDIKSWPTIRDRTRPETIVALSQIVISLFCNPAFPPIKLQKYISLAFCDESAKIVFRSSFFQYESFLQKARLEYRIASHWLCNCNKLNVTNHFIAKKRYK